MAPTTTGIDPNTTSDRPRPPRKLNRSANQLHRNQACLPCRRRRIKCDAARPHCSSCVRSFRFLARTQPDQERDARGVQCQYEDGGDSGEHSEGEGRVVEDDSRTAVHKLEARIADLQSALARLTSPTSSTNSHPQLYPHDTMSWMVDNMGSAALGPDSSPFTISGSQAQSQTHGHNNTIHTGPMGLHGMASSIGGDTHREASTATLLPNGLASGDGISGFVEMSMSGIGQLPHTGALGNTVQPSALPPHSQQTPRPSSSSTSHQRVSGSMDATMDHDANSGSQLNELLWPGWPSRLPTLEVLDHLVQTFFTIVPSISRILNRESLISRLGLPPQHANFPHLALLHAICAVTARYTAAVHTIPVGEVISNTNEEMSGKKRMPANLSAENVAASQRCFGERHSLYAQLEIRWSDLAGRRMLDVAQAAVILSVYLQQHAKWIEGWMMVGTAVRLVIPMGLMSDTSDFVRPPNAIIEPPECAIEREERRLLIAYLMTLDFAFSAPSGWPVSLSHDELWARLPASKGDFDRGGAIPENTQSWWNDNLYTEHPVVDPFVLYAKGCHLLGSVLKFTRKIQTINASEMPMMRSSAMFNCTDKEVSQFKENIPEELQNPFRPAALHKGIDPDLINAHLLPSVMAIKLHEPFADLTDLRNDSTTRVIKEARAVLDMVCNLSSTALDLSYALSPITSCELYKKSTLTPDYFLIAVRIFLQRYKSALQARDLSAAKELLSEIDVFRVTFSSMAHRFALSARHLFMIDLQLSAAHAESGVDVSSVREGADPLSERTDWRRPPMTEYTEAPFNWISVPENRSTDSGSGEISPTNVGTPAPDRKGLNKPTSSLFLTPTAFRATQVEQQAQDIELDAATAARFSPQSHSPIEADLSPSSQTSLSASLSGTMLASEPLIPNPPFHYSQYPINPTYPLDAYEQPYNIFSDTQAAWLHSVAAATIPRTYMGYGGDSSSG